MQTNCKTNVLVVTLGQFHQTPWWMKHIHTKNKCSIDYQRFIFKDKHSAQIDTREFPSLFIQILKAYIKWHKKYDYIFTFECDLMGFFVSFIQTMILWKNKPCHIILQFIMREKENSATSKLKYAVMKFCFSSLHKVVCSSSYETKYYREVFNWPPNKAVFIPFHTSPDILNVTTQDDGFVFSGGRSFRDYDTFIQSLDNINSDIIIVGYNNIVQHDRISVIPYLPLNEFLDLMARSCIVVVPLESKIISSGQTIILDAMAYGKPVIATRTSGTVDYIDSGKNGILVPPNDPIELNRQIINLLHDSNLRKIIARAARSTVLKNYLPQHYVDNIYEKIIFPDISNQAKS